MKLLRNLKQADRLPSQVVATIGNFDGVHLGHQALLQSLRQHAQRLSCSTLVILFEPQPAEYFNHQQAPVRLTPLRKKLQLFKAQGIDFVCCLRFNQALAQMSAESFAEQVIFNTLKVNYLLIGDDFKFGRNRAGDFQLLATVAERHQAIVDAFSSYRLQGERISSTSIRSALQQGRLDDAASALGRSFSLCGRVIHGDARARQWGIPTANIHQIQDKLPLSGVFAVKIYRHSNQTYYEGIANIGRRPTIEGAMRLSFEVHFFNFNESLYGEMLDVMFIQHIREEKKFNDVNALINQIHQDILQAKRMFSALMTMIE